MNILADVLPHSNYDHQGPNGTVFWWWFTMVQTVKNNKKKHIQEIGEVSNHHWSLLVKKPPISKICTSQIGPFPPGRVENQRTYLKFHQLVYDDHVPRCNNAPGNSLWPFLGSPTVDWITWHLYFLFKTIRQSELWRILLMEEIRHQLMYSLSHSIQACFTSHMVQDFFHQQ